MGLVLEPAVAQFAELLEEEHTDEARYTYVRDGAVDHTAYELCALSQPRDRLRAGDIWVAGNRQF